MVAPITGRQSSYAGVPRISAKADAGAIPCGGGALRLLTASHTHVSLRRSL